MIKFHDFFVNSELESKAQDLGWNTESIESSIKLIQANKWGELKQKINENREDYDILAFRGGSHELNRKAFSNPKMDVVLHPERDRKDSGMNHVDAEKAAENHVAVGFSLKQVPSDRKKQSRVLTKWRRNIKLCEKYKTPYLITAEVEKESGLRKPRDLAAVLKSLGAEGNKCVSKYPRKILEKNLKAREKNTDFSGHEAVE